MYLITLTPIDKFFFGGEITFTRSKRENIDKQQKDLKGEDAELKSFDENFSSYVVRSNKFPQQTSLLGMLRFAFLSGEEKAFKNGKIVDNEEAVKLIGTESFNVDVDTEEMSFGKIKKIHPCFLQRKTEKNDWGNLILAPVDHNLTVSFEEGEALLNNKKSKIPQITGYKAKEGLTSLALGNEACILKTDKLFTEDTRIGIDRNFDGTPNDGAFYKQISYNLSDKYEFESIEEKDIVKHKLRFAFYAELNEALPEQIVSLGGDNSRFKLTCTEKCDTTAMPVSYKSENMKGCYGKVILLSDAFIDKEVMDSCLFSINEITPFRFLKSEVAKTTEYYKFSGGNHLKRSEKKYNLYKQGSVFYFDTENDLKYFVVALKSKKRFRQIGYNHFEEFKTNKENNK